MGVVTLPLGRRGVLGQDQSPKVVRLNVVAVGALMLVPSSAVESMGMGGLLGAAALRHDALAASGVVPPIKIT